MINTFDVAVVGAGMADIVASRDLSRKGYSMVLLEARDRVGGRTYPEKAFGRQLELRGWLCTIDSAACLARTAATRHTSLPPLNAEKVYWLAAGAVQQGTQNDHLDTLRPAITRLLGVDIAEILPVHALSGTPRAERTAIDTELFVFST